MHAQPVSSLTLQFLAWVSAAPRSYGDVMEAWRTTCPRMTVWEDAMSDALVRREANGPMRDGKVSLTARGRSLVDAAASASCADPSQPASAISSQCTPG